MALSAETLQAPDDNLSVSAEKPSRKLAFLDFLSNSTNYKISVSNEYLSLT